MRRHINSRYLIIVRLVDRERQRRQKCRMERKSISQRTEEEHQARRRQIRQNGYVSLKKGKIERKIIRKKQEKSPSITVVHAKLTGGITG